MTPLLNKLSTFARSPQGKKLMRQASTYARSPEGRQKIAGVRSKLAARRTGRPKP